MLRVNDPRSRTRSKSPSGRIRERSRSRDTRAPSPPREKTRKPSKKYYDSDSADESRYASSRSSKRYHNYHPEDDKYQRSEKPKPQQPPGYYISDEEEVVRKHTTKPVPPKTDKYYQYDSLSEDNKRHSARPSRYEQYSDSLTDSDDDALAYGDVHYPPTSTSRGHSRKEYSKSSKVYYDSDSADDARYKRALVKIQVEKESAKHPRYEGVDPAKYASYENYRYAQTAQPDLKKPSDPKPTQHRKDENSYPINWAEIPECERPGYVPPPHLANLAANPMGNPQHAPGPMPTTTYAQPDPSLIPMNSPMSPNTPGHYPPVPPGGYNPQQYGQMPMPASTGATQPPANPAAMQNHTYSSGVGSNAPQHYAQPPPFQYAQPDPNIKYISKTAKPYTQTTTNQFVKPYSQASDAQYVEIKPKASGGRPHSLSVSGANGHMNAPGSFPDSGRPPASPLLEPYKGTYQSISPMPWPTSVPSYMDEGLSDIEPLDGPGKSKKDKSKKSDDKDKPSKYDGANIKVIAPAVAKKVTFYDPRPDAKDLKTALSHSNIDPTPLLDILPYLSSEDLQALRDEYKNVAKIGGKGINIAKQIKMQVPGAFGKVCYATALGRWGSEAHWANFWYRSNSLRRELLIESLIGRSNSEIREIKKCFRDQRYNNDLEKCMKAELKADKFRTAILLALEEQRQSNSAPLDSALVRSDVRQLHNALISRDGGETAMIKIIIVRGDMHLREVMHVYEATYHKNFAKEMIAKSQNLVGETLVHALNGALNRPMRDALLLHQAIAESGTGRERTELLISRLVRMHWEPLHLERVKAEYKKRYRKSVEDAIDDEVIHGGQKDWAEFCIGLVKSSKIQIANGGSR
ncbi:hypothetical protein FQN52_004010 [Onygenales sp. PD_12]|nr:hypothetical protein FQN52_004010 [Onygenales sp. PD_12]